MNIMCDRNTTHILNCHPCNTRELQQVVMIVSPQKVVVKKKDEISQSIQSLKNSEKKKKRKKEKRRCLWCNGYCRRIRTRRHEFKSSTRIIAFHIALIPLGKV